MKLYGYLPLIHAAVVHQRKNEYQECMRCLCRALEILFSQRIDPVVSLTFIRLPLPAIGLRLLRTETGVQVEITQSEYGQSDCRAVLAYCEEMQQTLFGKSIANRARSFGTARIPKRTFSEYMALRIRDISSRCLHSEQRIEVKRRQLRFLQGMQSLFQRAIPLCCAQNRILSILLGRLFHEPEERMTAILKNYSFYLELNYAKRLLHLDISPESERYLRDFYWPTQVIYQKLINADNSSRVLVSIHMGDVVGAFRVISAHALAERKAISLRREAKNEDNINLRFLDRMQHRVFRHSQNNSIEIVSALRKGNHTLAVLFDLKGEFGETVAVEFFGQNANFVKGPAQLAIAGRAALLPFVTYEDNGINCIVMERLISSELLAGENLSLAVRRITQQLVRLAEKWIRKNPAQWKYLASLPGYFRNTGEQERAEIGEQPSRHE